MFLFISGAEIVFVFFIVLLVFGADKIPSIARTLAKGMTQVRQATNDIKSEIQKKYIEVEKKTPESVTLSGLFRATKNTQGEGAIFV